MRVLFSYIFLAFTILPLFGQYGSTDVVAGVANTRSGVIVPDYTLDAPIPDNAVFQYDPETGAMTVYSTGGQEIATVTLKNGGKEAFPVTLRDKDGKLVQVDTRKNADGTTKTGADGKPVLAATTVTPIPDGAFNPNAITGDATVTFERGSGEYALDNWPAAYKAIALLPDNYRILAGDYRVPWKFLPTGGRDVVTAVLNLGKGSKISPDSIVFSTPQGFKLASKQLPGNRYELTVAAGQDKDVQELYALYPVQGSSSRFQTLGKLEVVTYGTQAQKLVLVPVNGAGVDKDAVERYLNEVYHPVGVDWSVEQADNFQYADTTAFFAKGSELLSAYTPAMRRLNDAYRQERGFAPGTAYLFVMDDSGRGRDRDAAGFMPRGKQAGYIFKGSLGGYDIAQVIAHELGHGRWRLRHTFDKAYGGVLGQGSTDNLMDYKAGNNSLAKWQWDQIVSPAWFTSPFEGDGEGESHVLKNARGFLDWIKSNLGKQNVAYLKNDFKDRYQIADYPNKVDGQDFTVMVDLGGDGDISLEKDSLGQYPYLRISFSLDNRYHNGFYFSIPYQASKEEAIRIWCYSYENFAALLHYLGMDITEAKKEYIKKLYADAIAAARDDCNKLDVIYETIPEFAVSEYSNEELYKALELIGNCSIGNHEKNSALAGSNFDTDESHAVLNILKAVDAGWLYNKANASPSLLEKVLSKIGVTSPNAGKIIETLYAKSSPDWAEGDLSETDYFLAGTKEIEPTDQTSLAKFGLENSLGSINSEKITVGGCGDLTEGAYSFGNEIIAGLSSPLDCNLHIQKKALQPIIITFENGTEITVPAIIAKWYLTEFGSSYKMQFLSLATSVVLPEALIKPATWAKWSRWLKGGEAVGTQDVATLLAKWDDLTSADVKKILQSLDRTDINAVKTTIREAKSVNNERGLSYFNYKGNYGGYQPSYDLNTLVNQYELTQDGYFVRFYIDNTSLPNSASGRWMISIEDYKAIGNDPKKIKDLLALPQEPDSWALVKIPKGTLMRDGTAGEIWTDGYYWGHGGGKQFEIVDWDKLPNKKYDWFKPGGGL